MQCPVCESTRLKRRVCHSTVLYVGYKSPVAAKENYYECCDCGETFVPDAVDAVFPLNFDHDVPEFDAYMSNPYEADEDYI